MSEEKPRRLSQFSLRAILYAVTAICVFLALKRALEGTLFRQGPLEAIWWVTMAIIIYCSAGRIPQRPLS